MSVGTGTPSSVPATRATGGLRRRFRDQPVIPLLLLLSALILLLWTIQPGILNRPAPWLNSTIRSAIPPAIFAACQTLSLLTDDIALSVAPV